MNLSEKMVSDKIAEYMVTLGYFVLQEVPTMGYSADIVARTKNKLTFIEVKLANWKRGLAQCSNHINVADYIYIAMATKRISEALIEQAVLKGFGIISYDCTEDKCEIFLKAKKNNNVWPPQKKIIQKRLTN